MHEHSSKQSIDTSSTSGKLQRLILVGNPNVGKSVIFTYLTGRYVTVSNYPGTTVEVTTGKLVGNKDIVVVDTPGINNLIPTSEDEVVTRNILLEYPDAKVIQVGDSRNLERTILLSLQLKEMGIPFVLCLNIVDEAREKGITTDIESLSKTLGIPVVETIATQHLGLANLIPALEKTQQNHLSEMKYSEPIQQGAEAIARLIDNNHPFKSSISLMLLASDESLNDWVYKYVGEEKISDLSEILRDIQVHFQMPIGNVITTERLNQANRIARSVVKKVDVKSTSFYTVLGKWSHHRYGGLVIGVLILFLMYEFVGVFGAGTLVNFLERTIFGSWLIPLVTKVVDTLIPIAFIHDLLVGDYGLLSMALSYSIAIVLPIVGTFFIAFGILEDSGYLPRLAVMMNSAFKMMGLNGKAVLPMVLGLGCDTMATMTTRILDSKKERTIVIFLLALGVPCSAQLGVILGMLAALSPVMTLLWIASVVGILFAVGYLSSKILPGQSSDFVLELPPMRRPKLSNIGVKTLARIEWYLREAVPLFFLGTFVLFVLDKIKLLGLIERVVSPVIVGFLGLPVKATEAFLIGFLRRDYGAAGLYNLFSSQLSGASIPMETQIQVVVSMITITLFMPCIANFFMIIKEQGMKTALAMTAFILPFSIGVAGVINHVLRWTLL